MLCVSGSLLAGSRVLAKDGIPVGYLPSCPVCPAWERAFWCPAQQPCSVCGHTHEHWPVLAHFFLRSFPQAPSLLDPAWLQGGPHICLLSCQWTAAVVCEVQSPPHPSDRPVLLDLFTSIQTLWVGRTMRCGLGMGASPRALPWWWGRGAGIQWPNQIVFGGFSLTPWGSTNTCLVGRCIPCTLP